MESSVKSKCVAFLGATLLAAGTSIGAGMLALPVLTGLAGFYPATAIYVISWLVITYASFVLLEVNLGMGYEANFLSMAKKNLGQFGKIIAFLTYIFLFYSVSIAYLAGSGSIIGDLLHSIFHINFPRWIGIVVALGVFGPSLYFGTRVVANTNFILVTGIVVSYILLLSMGSNLVNDHLLTYKNWSFSLMGIPVIITSFTFQNVIPSLTTYLKRNVKMLKWVIILGGLLPLSIYILWEWFVLGIVPIEGPNGIRSLLAAGQPASHSLKILLENPSVITFSQVFGFCAIVTSFLGVILSLFDFLADGFKVEKTGRGKLILCSFIFIPPLVLAILFPRAFLTALNYAGSFGCVILFLIMPPLMLWKARYHYKVKTPFRVMGGKVSLILLTLLGLSVIVLQFFLTFGLVKSS